MSRPVKDWYAVLGVRPGASGDDIDRAFRKQCFKWHPDRNQDDPDTAHERFVEIGEAYAVLSDPTARSRHDRSAQRRGTRPPRASKPRPRPRPYATAGFARAAADAADEATRRQHARRGRGGVDAARVDFLARQMALARGLSGVRWNLYCSSAALLIAAWVTWLIASAGSDFGLARFMLLLVLVFGWWLKAMKAAVEAREVMQSCRRVAERMVREQG